MPGNRIKQIIIGFLIFGQLGFAPSLVFAQTASAAEAAGKLGIAVPVSDANNGNTPGGVAGQTVNTAATVALTAANTLNQGCAKAEQTYFNTGATSQMAFSGLSSIGGSSVLLAQYDKDIIAIEGPPGGAAIAGIPVGFIPCRQLVLTLLDKIPASSVYLSNQKQVIYAAATSGLNNLKTREEAIKAKQANANQGFWKTLVFNILIKTSKAVADTLVNKLVNDYAIKNIKQYADSVATLMYDNQFIRDNYPNAQDQMMARAILTNPLVRTQIPPQIYNMANASLGFNPATLSSSDPNFYTKMAMVGSASANPYFLQTTYVSNTDQAHAAAVTAAQTQIAQSNGYKAPVNCAGSLAQQQTLDARNKAATDQLANRTALLNNLTQAQQLGQKVSPTDLAKAQADVKAAQAAWDSIPFTVSGTSSVGSLTANGNNTEGNIAIVMCEAIASPATLINKGIDQAFNAIGINMAQYNNNNLPGYISMIGDTASHIASNLIFGGTSAAKTAAVLSEGNLVAATTGLAVQYGQSQISANLAKGIDFEAQSAGDASSSSYTLSWQVDTGQISNASYVTISGDGIAGTTVNPQTKLNVPNKQPLSSSGSGLTIHTTIGGNYILTVYDSTGKAITAATLTIQLTSQTAYNTNANSPQVAGVFAAKVSTRGEDAGTQLTADSNIGIRGPANGVR